MLFGKSMVISCQTTKPTSPKIHKALRIWGETTCRPASPTANPPFIDDNFKIFLGHHQQSSYHQFSTYQFTMSFTQLWLLDRHGKQNPFFQIWQWFCCQVLLPEAGRPGGRAMTCGSIYNVKRLFSWSIFGSPHLQNPLVELRTWIFGFEFC